MGACYASLTLDPFLSVETVILVDAKLWIPALPTHLTHTSCTLSNGLVINSTRFYHHSIDGAKTLCASTFSHLLAYIEDIFSNFGNEL